jgi:hypothetical protein
MRPTRAPGALWSPVVVKTVSTSFRCAPAAAGVVQGARYGEGWQWAVELITVPRSVSKPDSRTVLVISSMRAGAEAGGVWAWCRKPQPAGRAPRPRGVARPDADLQGACGEVIARYDVHVAKYLGERFGRVTPGWSDWSVGPIEDCAWSISSGVQDPCSASQAIARRKASPFGRRVVETSRSSGCWLLHGSISPLLGRHPPILTNERNSRDAAARAPGRISRGYRYR